MKYRSSIAFGASAAVLITVVPLGSMWAQSSSDSVDLVSIPGREVTVNELAEEILTLEAEWGRIARAKPQVEGIKAFQRRLVLVDQVVADLQRGFERQRSAALMDLLDNTLTLAPGHSETGVGNHAPLPSRGGDVPPVSASGTVDGSTSRLDSVPTADQLLLRYEPLFAQPLPTEGISAEELNVMRRLYDTRLRRASDQIAERGRAATAADPEDAARAIAYSLVVPLLHVPDTAWSIDNVHQMPDWLQQPELLSQLEEASLRLHRPLTAWSFSQAAAEAFSDKGLPRRHESADAAAYLRKTSTRCLRDDRYDDAVACLQALLSLFSTQDTSEATETRFKLAEVLADIGKPAEAAQTLRPLIDNFHEGHSTATDRRAETAEGSIGRGVMLSSKYLYEAEDFEALFALSDKYRDMDAVGGYRPQVLYITWVAARRADRPHLAKTVRESFLTDYAAHPLAADIYFAEAMEALARSDYDEAQRLLEYIVYRYPDSRLIKRVEEIRKRLDDQATASP